MAAGVWVLCTKGQMEEYKEINSKLQNEKASRTLGGSGLLKEFQSLGKV